MLDFAMFSPTYGSEILTHMPISHNYKAIFVHIPKNAGESIETKLGIYGMRENPLNTLWGIHGKYVLQHLTASQMKRLFIADDVFNDYFKFAFVRNPWDKAVSEYHWYLRYGKPITFQDWVRAMCNRLESSNDLHVLEIGHNIPQYKFIYENDGKLLVDFVGRFEQLQHDFNSVCETLGIKDSTLPRLESTGSGVRRHYKEYYNNETKNIIARIYEKDIEVFCYEY